MADDIFSCTVLGIYIYIFIHRYTGILKYSYVGSNFQFA